MCPQGAATLESLSLQTLGKVQEDYNYIINNLKAHQEAICRGLAAKSRAQHLILSPDSLVNAKDLLENHSGQTYIAGPRTEYSCFGRQNVGWQNAQYFRRLVESNENTNELV